MGIQAKVMLEAKELEVVIGNKKIVKDLSFSILKNEKIVFSGPSGSGKTSILNVLLGFVKCKPENITYKGKLFTVDVIKKLRNDSVWVPQDIFLNYETGEELLKIINGKILDLEAITNLLNKVNLDYSLLKKPTSKLSGGEKQRLIIVACLLKNKEIIIMDEPTSALDPDNISLIIDLILKDEKKTVISTSHNKEWIKNCNKNISLK